MVAFATSMLSGFRLNRISSRSERVDEATESIVWHAPDNALNHLIGRMRPVLRGAFFRSCLPSIVPYLAGNTGKDPKIIRALPPGLPRGVNVTLPGFKAGRFTLISITRVSPSFKPAT